MAVTVPNDATDIASHQGDLLVSGSDGSVVRVDPRQGTVEGTFQSDFDVQALAVDGDVLYAGTPFGVFQKLDLTSLGADFTFAGVCGGPINSMALTAAELYLGDVTGQVYVYDKGTEFVSYAYPVDNDATAIVRDGDEFLVGGSDGNVYRVTQIVGTVLDTLVAPEPIADLWLEEPLGELTLDPGSLSLASGGSAGFELFAPTSVTGDSYILLGSASGTSPGVSSGGVHLALNPDGYFALTLPPFGDEPLTGSAGTFDLSGQATAAFLLPAGIDPALAGLTLHHAFVTYHSSDPTTLLGASNTVELLLAP